MGNSPLISVIVPIFKVEQYLDKCIESIVNQTYENLEIILVDDGSPDNSPAICDKWAETDNRIKVIHKKNEGVAIARNTALDIARGDYIGFVDGDDYCFADMYERLMAVAMQYNSDITVCHFYKSDVEIDSVENTSRDICVKDVDEVMPFVCLGESFYGYLWNKIYKADLVRDIRMPVLTCSQDLPYNYFAFKNAHTVAITDEQLYFYRIMTTSTTKSSFKEGAFDAIKAREIILEAEKGTEYKKYALRSVVDSCFVVLTGVIRSGKCLDKYDWLRNYILKYKKDIFTSKIYYSRTKFKTLILMFSKKLFFKITVRL